MADDDEFYILDARTVVGNCAMFWCPDGKGYTCELDKAGLYSRDAALGHRTTDVPVPRALVDSMAIRHVRLDWLRDRIDVKGYAKTESREQRVAWLTTQFGELVCHVMDSALCRESPAPQGAQNAPGCPNCGCANFVIRKRCRECGEDLVMHPDPDIDAEVRWDAEDGARSERDPTDLTPEEQAKFAEVLLASEAKHAAERVHWRAGLTPEELEVAEAQCRREYFEPVCDSASVRRYLIRERALRNRAAAVRDPLDPTWTKRPEYEPKTLQAKLGHLVEECNEIIEVMVPIFGNAHGAIQLVGKILRFGWDGTHHEDGQPTTKTNRAALLHLLPQLVREAEDVRLAAARMLAHLSQTSSETAEGGEQRDSLADAERASVPSAVSSAAPAPAGSVATQRARAQVISNRLDAVLAARAPAPAESAPILKCIDCRHYWERRGLCSIAIDPADPRADGPGRPWREPETCAPPWCPGFEARPSECPAVHASGDCKHGVPSYKCPAMGRRP